MTTTDYVVLTAVCVCVLVLALRVFKLESRVDALCKASEVTTTRTNRLNDPKWPKPL